MRPPLRTRAMRALVALGLALSTLLPGAALIGAAEGDLVLEPGTDQDLQVLNPWNSVVVADFEVFTLNYDLLVNFGQDLEPVPGFAESWTPSRTARPGRSRSGPDMKWSDGEPATSEDARYTYQLVLDAAAKSEASEDGYYLGQGYLEPYLTNAGITAVSAPDPETLVVETEFANTLLLQAYVPDPSEAHLGGAHARRDRRTRADVTLFTNEPPVVGTGPYQAVEWEPGEFIRFARNPNYWGEQGAADEVIIQHFASADTMVQALKTGEIDYVRGVLADQFDDLKDDPDMVGRRGHRQRLHRAVVQHRRQQGGLRRLDVGPVRRRVPRCPRLRDRQGGARRGDARRLRHAGLHDHPAVPHPLARRRRRIRARFDIEEAKRRLDAAGYVLDARASALDKEGKVINLRLTWPDSEPEHATNAAVHRRVVRRARDHGRRGRHRGGQADRRCHRPADGPADYDIYMWGWVGDPDPDLAAELLHDRGDRRRRATATTRTPSTTSCSSSSAPSRTSTKRKALLDEMQELVYDEAPYHILYYDAELHAYRTDKFAGWTNQPSEGGTPLFGYGSFGYTKLTDLRRRQPPSRRPSRRRHRAVAPSPAASPAAGRIQPAIVEHAVPARARHRRARRRSLPSASS